MSQFDFPRINFHGQVLLDTPTANNGVLEPMLSVFRQGESEAYMPPRCYGNNFPPQYAVQTDPSGGKYVEVSVINDDNFQEWAVVPLGSYAGDVFYHDLYQSQKIAGNIPGYWSYFGDLSMATNNVIVTGITVPDQNGNIVTFTPENIQSCPPALAEMIGAELSFKNNYFNPDSRTTAYMCDVDSIGQMCTQIFYGKAGLYKKEGSNQRTFFSGKPCKSTARWMNLNRVLNWAKIVPMGGSASFFSMIELGGSSEGNNPFESYTGEAVNCLLMRFVIHEVYEVRQPDYSKLPYQTTYDVKGNEIKIPKNPARAYITGSICPWKVGDLKTNSLSRMLKGSYPVKINSDIIPKPVPKGSTEPVKIPEEITMGNVPFKYDPQRGIISLDLINAINEYGTDFGSLPDYAGNGDVPPFQNFENYNFGTFELIFRPDGPIQPVSIGTFDFYNHYNMKTYLATGGMVDIPYLKNVDFSKGSFSLILNRAMEAMKEENIYVTTDQQGIYAEQNQPNPTIYMNDGLPKMPAYLRVLFRGASVSAASPVKITTQALNMVQGQIQNYDMWVYDQMQVSFPVNTEGCMTYGFVPDPADLMTNFGKDLFNYVLRTTMIVLRVMSSEPQLAPYLNGELPITWDVIYNNIFRLYKVMYPAMDKILPFSEEVWSDPFILKKMLQLIDEENWNQPLYMPVTRDLSGTQRKLLQMWANGIINKNS